MSRNQKIRIQFYTEVSVRHMEVYQCVVHEKQALKTIASKMSNLRLPK